MSAEKSRNEAMRWLNTADDDYETASILCTNKKFAQCCFHCQQSAEKAVKAVYYNADEDPWGHSIFKLITEISNEAAHAHFNKLTDTAKRLDQYYIPTRYPNGLPGTIPSETYGTQDAKDALDAAGKIIAAAKKLIGKN